MNTRIDQLVNLLLTKSEHCKHGCCCSEYIITQTYQTFKFSYLIKTGISLFQFLLKIKKNKLKGIQKVFLNKDNIRFCLFLTIYTLSIKGLHCILRNIQKEDKPIQAFYCGLIGGMISMACLNQKSRKFWALYMIVRALDTKFHNLQNMHM